MMKKVFSRAMFAAMGLVALLGLSACDAISDFNPDSFLKPTSYDEAYAQAATSRSPKVSSPTLLEDGVLTVGIKSTAMPPLYIEGSDGSLMGIDVDIAASLAIEMGLKLRFVEVSNASEAVGTTCDVVMDVSAGEDEGVTMVGSYAESAATFFHRGEPLTALVQDLDGKTVAVQEGSLSQQALHNTGLTMTETTFSSLNECFDALEQGVVDYVLCEAYPGCYLAAIKGDISYAGTLEVPSSIGLGVADDNAQLQSAVQSSFDTLRSNGIMDLIRKKWLAGANALTNANTISDIPEAQEETSEETETQEEVSEGGETSEG